VVPTVTPSRVPSPLEAGCVALAAMHGMTTGVEHTSWRTSSPGIQATGLQLWKHHVESAVAEASLVRRSVKIFIELQLFHPAVCEQ